MTIDLALDVVWALNPDPVALATRPADPTPASGTLDVAAVPSPVG